MSLIASYPAIGPSFKVTRVGGRFLCMLWIFLLWVLGKTSKGHPESRREVTMALLRTQPRVGSRPGPRVQIPISIRKTDGHYLTEPKQGRCVECKSNAHLQCRECSPSSIDWYNVSVCVTNSYVQVAYFFTM
jgi:hypothetical protein